MARTSEVILPQRPQKQQNQYRHQPPIDLPHEISAIEGNASGAPLTSKGGNGLGSGRNAFGKGGMRADKRRMNSHLDE